MLPNYLVPIRILVGLIVKAIRIDADSDGKVTGSEVGTFFTVSLLPLLMQAGQIKVQTEELLKYIKDFGFDKFEQLLRDMIKGELLPDEIAHAEPKIDKILGGLLSILMGIEDVRTGLGELIGMEPPAKKIKKV